MRNVNHNYSMYCFLLPVSWQSIKATFFFLLLNISLGYSQTFADSIVLQAEIMPQWKGCETVEDPAACTKERLTEYFQKHLKYPRAAIANNVEGAVGIGCIITKEGRIRNAKIIHDIGKGCGEEALRLVRNMPLWIPAKEDGETVNVLFNIQVPFQLDERRVTEEEITYEEPVKPRVSATLKEKERLQPSSDMEAIFKQTSSGKVYTRITQMPYFPGCSDIQNKDKKRQCSNKELVDYLSDNMVYPEEAKQKRMEGIVYVSFIVDEMGRVIAPRIIRDIGGGCGDAALKVVENMPRWEPGIHDGQVVKTEMKLPFRFFLSSGAADEYSIHWSTLKTNRVNPLDLEMALTAPIVVRDKMGNDISMVTLELVYERKGKSILERSNGRITGDMQKLVKKVKKGGELYVIASIQKDREVIEVYRIFDIIE